MNNDYQEDIVLVEELLQSNPFLSEGIFEKIRKSDLIIVPFPWGDDQEPHIDIELISILKTGREQGKHIVFSLLNNETPKIRDQRSVDLYLGIIIPVSVEIGLWIIGQIIEFMRHRNMKLKRSECKVKFELIQSFSKTKQKTKRISYEGPVNGLERVLESIKSMEDSSDE